MSKAEKFIREHTKTCSNVIRGYQVIDNGVPQAIHKEWLTPDQARKAVEIAREETLLEVAAWINDTFIFSKQAKENFSQTFNIMKDE